MELLAPAGSYQALRAAMHSGADAVYIGGTEFSARRTADNFSPEQMKEWIDYCHLYGVAVHVAANTLIKEKEAAAFLAYIGTLNRMGVDAVIIQDIGMAESVHQAFPQLPLHASTQMTVASLEGVRYLENLGFSRVVLSRELSRKAVKKIAENTHAELEVFVHGALCMCYSGQCLMSSMIGGRSGNRGLCAQPCRLPYTLFDGEKKKKQGYLLSPKDLCLADELRELDKIGITSLKIEGRLKRPEYVSTVVGVYRKCIDEVRPANEQEKKQLADAFCRSGFTDGYWKDQISGAMMSYQTPGNTAGGSYTEEAIRRCREEVKKIPVKLSAVLKTGKPLVLTMSDQDGHSVTETGTVCSEIANNRPLDRERLAEQLNKLGNTPYEAEQTSIDLKDGIVLPIRELNEVRRKAVEHLNVLRTEREERKENPLPNIVFPKQKVSKPKLTVFAYTKEQADAALEFPVCRLYAPAAVLSTLPKRDSVEYVTALPAIDRDDGKSVSVLTDGVLISHFSQLAKYPDQKYYGDFRLNLYNNASIRHYQRLDSVMPSVELNAHELSELSGVIPLELFVYGRVPLMVMENCPSKACAGICKPIGCALEDRQKERFPLICDSACHRILLNSKPIDMADRLSELKKVPASFYRLHFTVESGAECRMLLKRYLDALDGKPVVPLKENTFTRGHYFRGVE